MADQLQFYEEIESAFKYHLLKLSIKICMTNLRAAFNRLLMHSQLVLNTSIGNSFLPSSDQIEAILRFAKVISTAVSKRFQIFLKQSQERGALGYDKSKGVIMIKGLLEIRICQTKSSVLWVLAQSKKGKSTGQCSVRQMWVSLEAPFFRVLGSSFNAVRWTSSKTVDIENGNTKENSMVMIFRILDTQLRRFLNMAMSCLKKRPILETSEVHDYSSSTCLADESEEQQKQTKIQQIKSILYSGNRRGKERTVSRETIEQREFAVRAVMQILQEKEIGLLKNMFGILRWKMLYIYDMEMIEKLETEISVLQHEFESL